MERIETSKLNRGLKEVLDRIKQGESFVLTRYGKDVAYLTSPDVIELRADDVPGPSTTKPAWTTSPTARDELLNRIRSKQ